MRSFLTRLVHIAERPRLVLGLAMGLLIAIGLALAVRDGPRMKSLDEGAFLDLSGNLAFHGTFAHTNRPDIEGYDPVVPIGALRPTAYRAPGYVWFQVPFRWVGGEHLLLRAANAVLLALTLWLLYGWVVRRAGRLAGAASVVLVLLYPVLLYAAGTLYPQTLSAFLLVGAVRQLDALDRTSSLSRFALLGLTLGALVLTAPIHLLLLPVVIAWMLGARRGTWRQVGLTTLTAAGLVSAWVVRNSLVLGAVVGIATSSGFNLLAGNGPYVRHDQATGDLRWPRGVREQVAGKGEVERDRILTGAALRWMGENPGAAAALYGRKLLYWFAPWNDLVSDRLMPGGSGAGPRWLRAAAMLVGYGLLMSLLAVRLALARRDPPSSLELLLLALYLGGGMAYAVYFTRIRFRLPFDWLLIAIDALFLARVMARWRAGAALAGPPRSVESLAGPGAGGV
jgi:4-amino-4-deoxy-L-arabinose transferase-like glycosyltransferase